MFGPADVQTSRVYPGATPERLYTQTLQALKGSDLQVTETDRASGKIVAIGRFDARNWAQCGEPLRLYHDQGGSNQIVEGVEHYRLVELSASITDGANGATLVLDPAFVAEPVTATATTPECRTTGVLERQILDAAAAAA